MGPQDILTAQKQKYYTNSNNLNHESIQGEMVEQKVTKVGFGKMHSLCCCCRAAASFGSLVSGENHPGYRAHHHCNCSYTCTCATSPFGCSEEESPIFPCMAALCRGGKPVGPARHAFFPTSFFFKGSFLIIPPLPTQPPHFHMLLVFKANISPRLFGLVCPP